MFIFLSSFFLGPGPPLFFFCLHPYLVNGGKFSKDILLVYINEKLSVSVNDEKVKVVK